MAEMKSHVDLINDKEFQYELEKPAAPAQMHRSVFWGDNITMGRNVLPAGEHVPAHAHPEEQYSIVISGECDARCGDETFHMTPGCVCFAPSNVEHELWMWDESEVVVYDIFTPLRKDWMEPVEKK